MTESALLFTELKSCVPIQQHSMAEFLSYLQDSAEINTQLLDDPYLGTQLRANAHNNRTSEEDGANKPWYRRIIFHPEHKIWLGDFDKKFPSIAAALLGLPLTDQCFTLQVTPGPINTDIRVQHFDACPQEEKFGLRMYCLTDGQPRLFFRKLKAHYSAFYRSSFKGKVVPFEHCQEDAVWITPNPAPTLWALNNAYPHGYDFRTNTGRVTIVIQGRQDASAVQTLIDQGENRYALPR